MQRQPKVQRKIFNLIKSKGLSCGEEIALIELHDKRPNKKSYVTNHKRKRVERVTPWRLCEHPNVTNIHRLSAATYVTQYMNARTFSPNHQMDKNDLNSENGWRTIS